MSVRACVFGFVVLMAAPTGAGERLALKVSPAVAFAPANLIVRTTVEADSANRAMEVVAESRDFYRSSSVELDEQFRFQIFRRGRRRAFRRQGRQRRVELPLDAKER